MDERATYRGEEGISGQLRPNTTISTGLDRCL